MGSFAYSLYKKDLTMLFTALCDIFSDADTNTAYYGECTAEVIQG